MRLASPGADVAASFLGALLLISITLGGAIGWVLNLVEIARWHEGTGMLVLRVIGIFFAPIGAVIGWL